MTETQNHLSEEDRSYSTARKQSLEAMRLALSLDTGGHPTWTRDELHER